MEYKKQYTAEDEWPCSWESSRWHQMESQKRLTFEQKLNAVDQMHEIAAYFVQQRREKGLPVSGWHDDPKRT